ncbi:MAG: RNA polymerase sigma factor [Myxococcota bacterium]
MTPAPSAALTKSGAGPSDAALVVAARAGELWASEALFRRHARMALGLAYRLLPRDIEVDDVVQDSFVYALQRLDSLQNPQAFAAWLGSIVVRTVGKRLRRRRLLTRLGLRAKEGIDPDLVTSASAPPEVRVALRRVYAIVEELPSEQRIALVLRRVDGLEIPQIAEYMGLSLSTVKRRLKAAEALLERTGER